jgi:tripeptide aminopeptidase
MEINRQRLISTFLDLVKIPSPSWKEEKVFQYIEKCAGEIGFASRRSACRDSVNLMVNVPGDESKKPILFAAHTDTVTPCENVNPVETESRISSDGTTILGSDDKSAVAAFIEAMRLLKTSDTPHPPIEFLFTCAEEVGLHGMKGMDFSLIKSKRAFVFDCSGSVGTIIYQAPSQITIHLEIQGRAAHAGIEPEKGISAINVLSEIITKIPKGRIDRETTSNVGIISGGRATNIVAEKAALDMEIRSLSPKKLKIVEKKITEIMKSTANKHGAKTSIKSTLEYSCFNITKTDPVARLAEAGCRGIGVKPVYASSGGGSDTNVLNFKGVRALNLSIGMTNVHSTREFILKKDLYKGCELVLEITYRA